MKKKFGIARLKDNLIFRFMLAIVLIIVLVMGAKFIWDLNKMTNRTANNLLEKAQVITEQQKAVWDFMVWNQDKINYDSAGGFEYKFLTCSTTVMGVGAMLASRTEYVIKPTNIEYRNILNAPDEFEIDGIAWFKENPSAKEYWASTELDNKKVFRYMMPLWVEESCLECHGFPIGEIDMAGYPKEGWKVGDFAGAFSLIMPMGFYYEDIKQSLLSNAFFSLVLILLSVISIYFLMTKMVTKSLGKLEVAVARIGEGDWDIELEDIKAEGEIKRLVSHFKNMTEQLADLYYNLELKVEERTTELEKANLVLKKHQEELEQMNIRLKETNAYKSEFLAIMSHELRTPLTSIIAFAELILFDSALDDAEEEHYLKEVLLNSQNLLRLINNILDLAKIEASKDQLLLEVIDMADIISSVESIILPLAKNKNLDFEIKIMPHVPLTKADPEKIRRIVENLAGNAVKFTPNYGWIKILVDWDKHNNEILVKVSDNGIGIKEDQQKYIFEKFTQADGSSSRKYGGSGLGLSLAKELIELHQGWIRVESSLGGGSTFIVGLPIQSID